MLGSNAGLLQKEARIEAHGVREFFQGGLQDATPFLVRPMSCARGEENAKRRPAFSSEEASPPLSLTLVRAAARMLKTFLSQELDASIFICVMEPPVVGSKVMPNEFPSVVMVRTLVIEMRVCA